MNLISYYRKVKNLALIQLLHKSKYISGNLLLNNISITQLTKVKSILFFFNEPEYMHLGDHLFFIPLIQTFIDSGYEVKVAPTSLMQPLFNKINIPLHNNNKAIDSYDLIISRVELIDDFYNNKSILVNVTKDLTMPICEQLLHNFTKLFHLKTHIRFNYQNIINPDIASALHLPHSKKIILFNLFCDSSAFMITTKKITLLLNKIRQYALNSDYICVLIGRANDKLNTNIDFPYIDLRGKTDVIDIFYLANCSNVIHYIGFDAFVMHVFSLVAKPSCVVFRGRLFNLKSSTISKYHINLFSDSKMVTLIK
jgi:hypothetical protein